MWQDEQILIYLFKNVLLEGIISLKLVNTSSMSHLIGHDGISGDQDYIYRDYLCLKTVFHYKEED